MELKSSTISETWKLCTVGGFLGFLVLALFLTSNTPGRGVTTTSNVDLSSSSSRTFITFFSTTSSSSSPAADEYRVSPVAENLPPTPTATTTSTNATTSAAKVEPVDTAAADAGNATVTTATNTTTTTTPLFGEDDEVDPAPDNSTADVTSDSVDEVDRPASNNSTADVTSDAVDEVVRPASNNSTADVTSDAVDEVDRPASNNSTADVTSDAVDEVSHPASINPTADVTSDAFDEVDRPPPDNSTTAEPTSSNTTTTTETSSTATAPSPTMDAVKQPGATEFDLDDGAGAVVAEELAEVEKKKKQGSSSSCNMFEGRWVYRPEVSPMYSVYQCPFLEDKMSCRRNGRPDAEYEGYVWEPTGCDIPLFNGKDMLERLRGKRVIVAGDSLNRNMWESLACLIYTSISPSRAFVDAAGSSYKVLKAMDYDFTLEFYWCPFLVHLEERHHKRGRTKRVLHLDKMVPSSEQWRGADVMVFDSGHWWTHGVGNYKKWDVYERNGKQLAVESIPVESAYEQGLTTWSNWISTNINPNKTAVFFRSVSPEHKGKQWCFNATRPIPDDSYVNIFPKPLMDVAERVVAANGALRYLNITWLSGYRQDAHPAMFRYEEWKWKVLTAKYMRTVPQQADCSHWCLPGLPDTWNRLLYASLFYSEGTGGGGGVNRENGKE